MSQYSISRRSRRSTGIRAHRAANDVGEAGAAAVQPVEAGGAVVVGGAREDSDDGVGGVGGGGGGNHDKTPAMTLSRTVLETESEVGATSSSSKGAQHFFVQGQRNRAQARALRCKSYTTSPTSSEGASERVTL